MQTMTRVEREGVSSYIATEVGSDSPRCALPFFHNEIDIV
jgi:hypothetical protein